jgi:hypothetical protein
MFVTASLLTPNAFADVDFEIIKIKTYENKLGLRTAKVTVKNTRGMGNIISSEDFVGITADGIRVRAKTGSSSRVKPKETFTLMLNFKRQKYPIEEIDFYWK